MLGCPVCFNDVGDTEDFGVSCVAIKGKAMAGLVDSHVAWDATEAEDGEALVRIIGLNDGPNHANSAFVLVLRSKIMQGAWTSWVPI